MEETMRMDIDQHVRELLKSMSEGVYEKEHILAMSLLSAVAGESIFLLGPPGTAKSLVARRLKMIFKDRWQLWKFTPSPGEGWTKPHSPGTEECFLPPASTPPSWEQRGVGGTSHLWQLGDCPRYLFLLLAVALVSMLSLYSGPSKDLADKFGCNGWDANTVETLLPYLWKEHSCLFKISLVSWGNNWYLSFYFLLAYSFFEVFILYWSISS